MSKLKYEPDKWNQNPLIRSTHNCYSYFLNQQDTKIIGKCRDILEYHKTRDDDEYSDDPTHLCKRLKPQPGYYSGSPEIVDKTEYNCENIHHRVLQDNPDILVSDRESSCPKNYYKGSLTVSPGLTYHFYRKDHKKYWSHKDGEKRAVQTDASGNLIHDPKNADRNYGFDPRYNANYHLSDICHYYCIPNDGYKQKNMLDKIVPKFTSYKLVIVGAGISGLYLATRLQESFPKIVIIEQSNRIGGRIISKQVEVNGQDYILEVGANRFSKYHHRLMKLIKELDLNKYLTKDTDDASKLYVSSKLFNYHNNVDIKYFFRIILDYADNFNKSELQLWSFTNLAQDVLSNDDFTLLHKLWEEFITLSRVSYNGGRDAKFRLHPTYQNTYCQLDLTDAPTDNRYTPYLHNYIHLFKMDAFTGIRMVYTLLFNKKRNTYYRLSTGNIILCNKLLYQFRLNGGEIIYNTQFKDFIYKDRKFTIKCQGRVSTLIADKLILAIPTEQALLIPSLSSLHKYLHYSRGSRLAFIHAIYKKDKRTKKLWFSDIPQIITDNTLCHIIPIDKDKGSIMLAYLANSKKISKFKQLYDTSIDEFYTEIEKNLKILFPNLDIPKPEYLSFKSWKEGTYRWKRKTDYCNIYPLTGVPLYLSNESYSYRGGWIEGSLEIADEIIKKII